MTVVFVCRVFLKALEVSRESVFDVAVCFINHVSCFLIDITMCFSSHVGFLASFHTQNLHPTCKIILNHVQVGSTDIQGPEHIKASVLESSRQATWQRVDSTLDDDHSIV